MIKCVVLLFITVLPTPADAAFWLAGRDALSKPRQLFEERRYEEVIASLSPEVVQRLPKKQLRQAYYYLGVSHERAKQTDKALGVLQLSVKLFPKDINLLTELAWLLHRMGLEEQAAPLFQKVLSLHPNNASSQLGLAEIDRALGFFERSCDHYERALETMSDQAAVWRDYGEVMLERRNYSTAEFALSRALKIAPDDADAAFDMALAQRGQGRLEEALATLAKAMSDHPERGNLSLAYALWLLEAGHGGRARAACEQILKKDPDEPLALWIRARLNLKADRYNLAVADLRAAATAGRRSPFAQRAAQALLDELSRGR